MSDNPTASAFACVAYGQEGNGHFEPGLTKRELIAAMCLQGMLANDWQGYAVRDPECEAMATAAVNYAEALLDKLKKDTNE
jgi:hypothetical protein